LRYVCIDLSQVNVNVPDALTSQSENVN